MITTKYSSVLKEEIRGVLKRERSEWRSLKRVVKELSREERKKGVIEKKKNVMGNNVRWCSVFIASCLLLSHSVVTLKLFFNLSLLWLHTGPMHSHPTQYNVPHSRIFTATKQQQQSSTLSQCILHAPWEKIEKLLPFFFFSHFFWKRKKRQWVSKIGGERFLKQNYI